MYLLLYIMQLHVYKAQFGSVRASDYCRSQELSYVLDLKQENARERTLSPRRTWAAVCRQNNCIDETR